MTEFWKSTPKFYCKTCKVYLADNKQTRLNHDNSRSHKDKLLLHQQKLKDEKLHGLQSEYELKKTLHEIDVAAKQAVMQDRQDYGTSFYQSRGPLYTSHRQFTPSLASQASHNTGAKIPVLSETSELLVQDNLRQDKTGRYVVNGITYLEGNLNEDKLIGGVECELFHEQLDDWLPCTIIRRKEYQIPNTTVILKSYDVKFIYPADDVKKVPAQEIVQNDVKSENLRLILDETIELNTVNSSDESKVAVNEDTGIGGWQTVSITEVNEEEEEKKRIEYEEERQKELLKQEIERKELEQLIDLKARDDAMSAYDPYGTNMYKGMNIAEGVIDYTDTSVAKGNEVTFKKRKTGNNESKKMFRRKDDE